MHLKLNVLFSSWMEKLNRRGAHSSCVQLSAAAGSPASIRPIVRADFKTKVPRASRTVNVFLDEISCNLSQGIQQATIDSQSRTQHTQQRCHITCGTQRSLAHHVICFKCVTLRPASKKNATQRKLVKTLICYHYHQRIVSLIMMNSEKKNYHVGVVKHVGLKCRALCCAAIVHKKNPALPEPGTLSENVAQPDYQIFITCNILPTNPTHQKLAKLNVSNAVD